MLRNDSQAEKNSHLCDAVEAAEPAGIVSVKIRYSQSLQPYHTVATFEKKFPGF
jgi:hypothetical protein